MEASERKGIKNSIKRGKKKYTQTKWLKYFGFGAVIAGIIVLSYFFLLNNKETVFNIDLPEQSFSINNMTDTVIETKNGLIVAIPEHAFTDESGNPVTENIDFQIKEAFDKHSIITSGLTTTSNGELLATGGMFFLEAFSHGKKLKLAKGKEILLDIPNKNHNPNMMLFDGEYKEDGTINWVNPKPFDKDLITYDITTLDFYPNGYPEVIGTKCMPIKRKEDTLNILTDSTDYSRKDKAAVECIEVNNGIMNFSKRYTDSLYYSFSRLFEVKKNIENLLIASHLYQLDLSEGYAAWGEMGSLIKESEMKNKEIKIVKLSSEQYHKLHQDNIPYNLPPIVRLEKNEFHLKVSDEMLELFPVPSWLSYDKKKGVFKLKKRKGVNCQPSGINPAKIQAIWNERYNNTILATKEFEARLKLIHELRYDELLDLYVNNIDKPLWYIDSIANFNWEGSLGKFEKFYKQRKGGVKVNDDLANSLVNYYSNKQKEFTKKSSEAYNTYNEKKAQLLNEFRKATTKKQQEEFNRKMTVYQEELEVNLNEAYRQLGKPRNTNTPTSGRLRTTTSKLGAKNVDYFVRQSTRKRETLNYTDPNSGKKAVIEYHEVEVVIQNETQFDKVYVYMIPDSLSSFNRMTSSNNANYKGKLNELFKYGLFCLAYKGEQAYYYESTLAKGVKKVTLIKISESALKNKLNRNTVTKNSVEKNIKSDIDFYKTEVEYNKKTSIYAKNETLTYKVGKFLFPGLTYDCIINSSE